METFPQVLNRIAIEYAERKNAYIRMLEAVVASAKTIASDRNFEHLQGAEELKDALKQLDEIEKVD